jgi:hypothetical protein
MDRELETMEQIIREKDKDMQRDMLPLDDEGRAVAEEKRKTFDLPTNAVKVDPLR